MPGHVIIQKHQCIKQGFIQDNIKKTYQGFKHFFNNVSTIFFISEKFFFSRPGRAIKIMSFPLPADCALFPAIAANRLLNLFLSTAFFDIFWLTIKANLLHPVSFAAAFKTSWPSLWVLPFLKILSKSFLFFILLFFGSMFYTLIFFLPFCLLLCKTCLPVLLFFLLKKPCVLALFFFLGLYVKLIIV